MAKIFVCLMAMMLTVAIQGAPVSYDEIIAAAKSGNWDQFQTLVNGNLGNLGINNPEWKPLDFHNIRSLKPPQGGQVYGEAEYTFQSSSNINGQKTHESGGHKIINDNGKVEEFNFKP